MTSADGLVQIVEVSNAPFARPEPVGILRGIALIEANSYQVRSAKG